MRKGIFSGETIYLTEKEWRESLKRFDLSVVVESKGEYDEEFCEILGDGCYLCTKYRVAGVTACGSCPLNTEVNTCGELMEDIVGDSLAFHAEINSGVWWMKECNREARADVMKIHKALMKMERVGRRGR